MKKTLILAALISGAAFMVVNMPGKGGNKSHIKDQEHWECLTHAEVVADSIRHKELVNLGEGLRTRRYPVQPFNFQHALSTKHKEFLLHSLLQYHNCHSWDYPDSDFIHVVDVGTGKRMATYSEKGGLVEWVD